MVPAKNVVVLDLQDKPPWIDRPLQHAVPRVENLAQLDLYRCAEQEIFPNSGQFVFNQLSRNIRAGSMRQVGYIAFVYGSPASIGRLETHAESWFAGLYGGGTVERFRRRGLYRTIVAVRAR